MTGILGEIEMFLFNELLSEASSPAVKKYALDKLKGIEAAMPNAALKSVLQALEAFLAAPAA